MRAIGKTLCLMMATLIVLIAMVGASSVRRQLVRDRECSARMQRAAQRIESYRAQYGRLPRKEELPSLGVPALRFAPARDARGRDVYRFTVWRGEWAVEYDSASGEDSCDSKPWKAAAWLAGVLIPLFTAALWLGMRSGRKGNG